MEQVEIIEPNFLLTAYQQGVFPMSPTAYSNQIDWFKPDFRGIFPMDNFKLSKNVLRAIRNQPHQCYINRDFRATMLGCANRFSTWISPIILNSYCYLHSLGFAHSVEIYDEEDNLVGGLYGVSLAGAFFGESMFKKKPEMDKFALYYCHQQMLKQKMTLWDTQYYTDHLGTMGAIEIPASEYEVKLEAALKIETTFFPTLEK